MFKIFTAKETNATRLAQSKECDICHCKCQSKPTACPLTRPICCSHVVYICDDCARDLHRVVYNLYVVNIYRTKCAGCQTHSKSKAAEVEFVERVKVKSKLRFGRCANGRY